MFIDMSKVSRLRIKEFKNHAKACRISLIRLHNHSRSKSIAWSIRERLVSRLPTCSRASLSFSNMADVLVVIFMEFLLFAR